MANKMLLDDTRAPRREQREARIARKRERREARALKHQHHTIGLETLALETIDIAPSGPRVEEPAPTAETAAPTPARPPVTTAAKTSTSQQPIPNPVAQDEAPPAGTPRPAQGESRRVARRQRDIAEFLERRAGKLSLAREEAKERIARLGEEETVHDALMALAHPEASPWQQHRERVCEAIDSRRIPEIGAAARRACRGAAADAARTSRRAPDPDSALAVAIAYAIVARAPWAAIRSRHAERSVPTRKAHRPFWR
jgi:predicted acylesterase/phospholipase RssA